MAITFPTYQELVDRIRADIAAQLPEVDPTIYGSFVRALADSLAGRAKDIVDVQEQMLKQFFPQTAEGSYLELWANYEDLTRNAAEASTGDIVFTGTVGTEVPEDTEVTDINGNIFKTNDDLTLAAQSIAVSSITRSGTTAMVTTTAEHNLASNIDITIAGANETAYNGTFTITVSSATTFTYTVTGAPSTPATGTITASYDGGYVEITSDSEGSDLNLDSGAKLTLSTPITDVDMNQYVTFAGTVGGADVETDAELLVRVLQSRQNPVTNFNTVAIEKQARTIAGVTRVKVIRTYPEVGDTTVLFVRDNDDNIFPDAGEVAEVKAAIVEIMPANMDTDFVYVQAPGEVQTDFTFSAIDPDTTTMQTAIENNLAAFFDDQVDFGESIAKVKYEGIISNTIDPETGDDLLSFTLSTPTTAITVSGTQLATLGDVTF